MDLRDASFEPRPDGSLLVRRPEPLGPYPGRLTERLGHWAARAPERVFLARRAGESWRRVSYAQALQAACAIGQALLDRGLSLTERSMSAIDTGIDRIAIVGRGVIGASWAAHFLAPDPARGSRGG
jgi:feruloyl-CoA synthase